MSFAFYMNMEKLSLIIAKKHIEQMTNDNMEDDISLDKNKLLNNMENGFVAITQLMCFIESFLNTIINSCIGYENETLLKCNIQEKIDIIFLHYGADFSIIKSQHTWESYRVVTKVRNEMIHFKKTYVGHGSGVPCFNLGKKEVGAFFTKDNINKLLDNFVPLAKAIADELGLVICDEIDVFECEGKDGLTNYVFDKNTSYCDDSRVN